MAFKGTKHIEKKGAGKHGGKQRFGGKGGIAQKIQGHGIYIQQAFAQSATRGQKKLVKGKGKGQKGMIPAAASLKTSKYMDKLGKIDASRKVWVGGLKEGTTWKQLHEHFKDVAKP